MIKLVWDFNKTGWLETISLGSVASNKGLQNMGRDLDDGVRVILWDGGLEVEAILEKKGDVWLAHILWKTLKHAGTPEPDEGRESGG